MASEANGAAGDAACLELGNAFRGAVVRQDHFEQPATWLASVNAADETSIPRLVVASSPKEV
jgi:hypothetical protein